MRTVVAREGYRITVDDSRNRLLFEVWGDVVDHGLFATILEDWRKACSVVRPGFTLLADYTQVGVFALPQIWSEAQALIVSAGVEKSAVFWGKRVLGRYATEKAAQDASTEYSMRRRSFETRAEAEAWLDQRPVWMQTKRTSLPDL